MVRTTFAALLVALAITADSCAKIKEIEVTSAKLESVTPTGLSSVRVVMAVGIENSTIKFEVDDICGTIYYDGEAIVDYTAESVTIERKSSQIYSIPIEGQLSSGASIVKILKLSKSFDTQSVTVDVNATVKAKGLSKDFSYSKVPLKKFLGSATLK